MIAYIDLTTNEILAVSTIGEPNNVTSFECPDYVDIAKYDYVPSIQGVYDPNGFVLKEVISENNQQIELLVNAGFTIHQAQSIALIINK
jgi:hypothetical protein